MADSSGAVSGSDASPTVTAAAASGPPAEACPTPNAVGTSAGEGETASKEDEDDSSRPDSRANLEALAALVADARTVTHGSDNTLRRFLRAEEGDVAAAAKRYRATQVWRAEKYVDAMQGRPYPFDDSYVWLMPQGFHRTSRQGHPLYMEVPGRVDMPRINRLYDMVDCVTRHVWHMEEQTRLIHASDAARPDVFVDKAISVVDLDGLNMYPSTTSLRILRDVLHIDQTYYPERMHRTHFVNARWVFTAVWKVIAPWLHPVTRSKLTITGADKDAICKALEPDVDPRDVPAMFGGECECPGSCIPMLHHMFSPPPGHRYAIREVNVSAGAAVEHVAECPAGGTVVLWQFRVASKDVGFSLTWIPAPAPPAATPAPTSEAGAGEPGADTATLASATSSGGGRVGLAAVHHGGEEGEVILARSLVATPVHAARGRFLPKCPGRLVLRWDNEHARLWSKAVTYIVDPCAAADTLWEEIHGERHNTQTHTSGWLQEEPVVPPVGSLAAALSRTPAVEAEEGSAPPEDASHAPAGGSPRLPTARGAGAGAGAGAGMAREPDGELEAAPAST